MNKLKCIVCKKEIVPGHRPTGEPNGVGFQMASGKTYNVCADCVAHNFKKAIRIIRKGEESE